MIYKLSMTAAAYSCVLALPPRSPVIVCKRIFDQSLLCEGAFPEEEKCYSLTLPSARVLNIAAWILSACSFKPMCCSIMIEDSSSAVGLARPLPAISGADPCTASKMEHSLPMFAEGVRPRPPIRPAHMSERMSPYRLGMTRTLSL
nr:hypothetical protein CFP56_77607 [Quercus suber]